jgi:Rieske Fe-S protein
MNRKEFIKTCGFACLGASSLGAIMQSCISPKSISANIIEDDLIVPLSSFKTDKDNSSMKKYVIVNNNRLLYPICVFQLGDNKYTALWMQCTHQGSELRVFGDTLQCPSHGSEFDNTGSLLKGPANKSLRTFPVKIENDHLLISLKAV